jgi:uncharacterized protein with von Willebrand factor type A (vWA) domain
MPMRERGRPMRDLELAQNTIRQLRSQILQLKHDREMAEARPPKFSIDIERAALTSRNADGHLICPYCRSQMKVPINLLRHLHSRHGNLDHPGRVPLPPLPSGEIPGLNNR